MKKINNYEARKERARMKAIEWQGSEYGANRSTYYSELSDAAEYFGALANAYGLREEFEENGIPTSDATTIPPLYLTTDRNHYGAWILQAEGRGFEFPRRVYYFSSKAEAVKNYREEFGLKGERLTEIKIY